jgi:hypothetical protein
MEKPLFVVVGKEGTGARGLGREDEEEEGRELVLVPANFFDLSPKAMEGGGILPIPTPNFLLAICITDGGAIDGGATLDGGAILPSVAAEGEGTPTPFPAGAPIGAARDALSFRSARFALTTGP